MKILTRVLAIAWMIVAALMITWTFATPLSVWPKAIATFPGAWDLFTRTLTVVGAPFAAVQIWRSRDSGHLVLMIVAANATLFYSFVMVVVGSRYWPLKAILFLGVLTISTEAISAVRRIRTER